MPFLTQLRSAMAIHHRQWSAGINATDTVTELACNSSRFFRTLGDDGVPDELICVEYNSNTRTYKSWQSALLPLSAVLLSIKNLTSHEMIKSIL
jgi:hypothetical protein